MQQKVDIQLGVWYNVCMMKHLDKVKYPKDFECPKMVVLSDEYINKLVQQLSPEQYTISTGNTLVTMPSTQYIEVYVMVAQSKCQIIEGTEEFTVPGGE